MSDSWVVQNLNNALSTWNEKLAEVWQLLLMSPQSVMSAMMKASGVAKSEKATLPDKMVSTIEECGFFESVPLWAVTLIGSLFITVLSFIIILTVYGRFFKLYMYTALSPIPLASFAGQPSQSIGKRDGFQSMIADCLHGKVDQIITKSISRFARNTVDIIIGDYDDEGNADPYNMTLVLRTGDRSSVNGKNYIPRRSNAAHDSTIKQGKSKRIELFKFDSHCRHQNFQEGEEGREKHIENTIKVTAAINGL